MDYFVNFEIKYLMINVGNLYLKFIYLLLNILSVVCYLKISIKS